MGHGRIFILAVVKAWFNINYSFKGLVYIYHEKKGGLKCLLKEKIQRETQSINCSE